MERERERVNDREREGDRERKKRLRDRGNKIRTENLTPRMICIKKRILNKHQFQLAYLYLYLSLLNPYLAKYNRKDVPD